MHASQDWWMWFLVHWPDTYSGLISTPHHTTTTASFKPHVSIIELTVLTCSFCFCVSGIITGTLWKRSQHMGIISWLESPTSTDLQVLMYFFLVVFSCISDVLQILTVKHISMLVIMFVCLLPCLGFNGTFSTNRLYRAITVGYYIT